MENIKDGNSLSKSGDTVTYVCTINNSNSIDSPNLMLDTISDTLLGDLSGAAAAAGSYTFLTLASNSAGDDWVGQASIRKTVPYTPTSYFKSVASATYSTDSADRQVD